MLSTSLGIPLVGNSLDPRCQPDHAELHTAIWRGEKEGIFVESLEMKHNLSSVMTIKVAKKKGETDQKVTKKFPIRFCRKPWKKEVLYIPLSKFVVII